MLQINHEKPDHRQVSMISQIEPPLEGIEITHRQSSRKPRQSARKVGAPSMTQPHRGMGGKA